MPLKAKFQVWASSILLACSIIIYIVLYLNPTVYDARVYSHEASPNLVQAHEHHLTELGESLSPGSHRNRAVKHINLILNITSGYRYPDGVRKHVFLINGHFPGPTIEARSGDTLDIQVYNYLDGEHDDGLAVHWHGLILPNEMDGVVGLTQRGIRRHQSFTYRFQIDETQFGTFWYHAHSHVQRADGLYGAFIIHRPAINEVSEQKIFDYEQELLLLIGDWYHRSAQDVLAYYRNWRNFGVEPAPDSLLINGHGYFNCSMAVPARPLNCKNIAIPHLTLNSRRTRLRVINTGALTGFTLSVSGYQLSLLQVDGGSDVTKGNSADSIGILYPGERMDILIGRKEMSDNIHPQMGISLDQENLRFPNLALTPNQFFPLRSPTVMRADGTEAGAKFSTKSIIDLTHLSGVQKQHRRFPDVAGYTFLFYTKIEIRAKYQNIPKGFINRTSWVMIEEDTSPLIELSPSERTKAVYAPQVHNTNNRWVDVVVNNLDDKGHPFHLHGYDFWILSSHKSKGGAYEAYNPFDHTQKPAGGPMNIVDPVKKDTVFVPRMGYVVLRFVADNPGLWYFHCHVLWHESVGMAMAFQIGDK